MALPKIYQSSVDARAAGAQNGMTDDESQEPTPDAETGTGEPMNNEGDQVDNSGESEQGSEGVSPQEQQQYDELVTAGMTMMYQDASTIRAIVAKIKEGASGPGGLSASMGQQAATIMLALTRGLKQHGKTADPDVVLHAGLEILSDLAEACMRAGLFPSEQFDKMVQDASYEATRFYGDQELKSGQITPEMRQQAQQTMQQDQAKHAPAGSIASAQQQPQPQQPAQPQPQGVM